MSLFDAECAEGTFGVDCEWVCNCRSANEVCNKSTGECQSGCRSSFAGLDCQIRKFCLFSLYYVSYLYLLFFKPVPVLVVIMYDVSVGGMV